MSLSVSTSASRVSLSPETQVLFRENFCKERDTDLLGAGSVNPVIGVVIKHPGKYVRC